MSSSFSSGKVIYWNKIKIEIIFDNWIFKTGYFWMDTNYDHQVIIELEDDKLIHDLAIKIFSKHPLQTTWVQVDCKAKVFRVVYGNLALLSRDSRVYLAGHGSGKLNVMTNLYHLQANDIVTALFREKLTDTLNYQKRNFPLIINCPKKIGLISCQIASQAYGRNSQDQFGGVLLSELIKIFGHSTEIVGYTNNIGILPGGGKKLNAPGYKASYSEVDGIIEVKLSEAKRPYILSK